MSGARSESAAAAESHVLLAAHRHIAAECAAENKRFLQCKRNSDDPQHCLQQGQEVSNLDLLKGSCPQQFEAYSRCLDAKDGNFEACRAQQKALEGCQIINRKEQA